MMVEKKANYTFEEISEAIKAVSWRYMENEAWMEINSFLDELRKNG